MGRKKKSQEQKNNMFSQLIWHQIDDEPGELPDDDIAVLVYDDYMGTTVICFTEHNDNGELAWIDERTQVPLKEPVFWTDIPFPDGK